MYFLIIQWSIISLILIVLIHYLYSFFQTTLTIPKIKDLVNRPANAYKEIYETINNDHVNENKYSKQSHSKKVNNQNYQNNSSNQNMKDELKSFLNNLNISSNNSQISMNNDSVGNLNDQMTNISSFEFGNHYSSY